VKVVLSGIDVRLLQQCERFHSVSCEELETQLRQYCISVSHEYFELAMRELRELAFDLAEEILIKQSFNKSNGVASHDWGAQRFLRRHPGLSFTKTDSTSIVRIVVFNKKEVGHFNNFAEGVV
jgi:hypothetical protein